MASKLESCPEAVLRSIPWYPDQGLTDVERGEVQAHAADCEACRREIEMLQGAEVALPAAPDADALYAKILGRIEAEEPSPLAPTATRFEAERSPRRRLMGTHGLALAAGVLVALCVGLAGGLLFQSAPSDNLYRTAAEPNPAAAGVEELALDVIFRRDATAEQITSSLRAIRAEIVSGPSRLGVYRVELTADGDPPAAAKLLLGDGTGVATFAEAVRR